MTIDDVAALSGVSRSSVSRYLNGNNVRSRDAIRSAIEKLGYEASPIARSLRSGRTSLIGVLVADVSNPFFGAAFRGIESVARSEGSAGPDPVQLLLCNTDEHEDRLAELLEGLAGRIDALIIAPPVESDPPAQLARLGIPVVLLDRVFAGPPVGDAVLVDNEGGVAAAVHHLAELGHVRIGFISGPLDSTPGRGRYEGYRQGLDGVGLPFSEELVAFGDFRKRSGEIATAQLLALDEPPTALIATNNLMALGALDELDHQSVQVGHELSFVGFDDFEAAELMRPPVATVSRPMAEQGEIAMRLLLARMNGNTAPFEQIVLPTRFVPRGSCAPRQGPQTTVRHSPD
ncbi:MAG: LacI family DNA-binding transcriptional regulator [Nitriliruptoraceae bacterium]|nr:LacI family DNA-binding transcriptional regulator [Nitriliruptoraceae bacterium]